MSERFYFVGTLFALTILLANITKVKFGNVTSLPITKINNEDGKSESRWQRVQHGSSSMRIALVMYGILDHDNPAKPNRTLPPPEVSLTRSFSSIRRHVIVPAQENGYTVDVFAHSWNVEAADTIVKVYQSNASRFEQANGRNMFHSIEAGLNLRKEFEKIANVSYDWVLIMRHDIFFYNKYDVTELNKNIFYVTNWCFVSSHTTPTDAEKWGAQHGTERCVGLETFEHDRKRSVPDFLFVSSPDNVDRVFINLMADLEDGVFERGTSCCGHAIAGGRIFSLYDIGQLVVGRYKVHAFDMTILRDWTEAQEALSNTSRGLWLHPNQYNWAQPHRYSQCTDNTRYCFNVSNNSCPFPAC